MQIRDLNISARSKSCLINAGYQSVEDIKDLSDEQLIDIKNLNASGVEEIRREINSFKYNEDENKQILQANIENVEIEEENETQDTQTLQVINSGEVSIIENDILSKPIWTLGLSLRLCDILKGAGILFVRDLCDLTVDELKSISRLSYMNRLEIEEVLKEKGLFLRD